MRPSASVGEGNVRRGEETHLNELGVADFLRVKRHLDALGVASLA